MGDDSHDLAQILALHTGIGPGLLQVAYRLAQTPRGARVRQALARAGHRGAMLGLHLVPGLVLADVIEPEPGRVPHLGPGQVLAYVWGGDREAAVEIPDDHAPAGVAVVIVWRPARPWHYLRAWWRLLTWNPTP